MKAATTVPRVPVEADAPHALAAAGLALKRSSFVRLP